MTGKRDSVGEETRREGRRKSTREKEGTVHDKEEGSVYECMRKKEEYTGERRECV